MVKERSLFEQVLYEAPEDDAPPDLQPAEDTAPDSPPDLSVDDTPTDNDTGGGPEASGPPDLEMDNEGEGEGEDVSYDDEDDTAEGTPQEDLGIDEKISNIMNMNLYQRYLTLLTNVGNQLSSVKNNSDALITLAPKSIDIITSLEKLDENIRLYIDNYFVKENYSKNLLFFNKCLNLLKLLNDTFDKNIRTGIRGMNNN
jgi:hypothetical protein